MAAEKAFWNVVKEHQKRVGYNSVVYALRDIKAYYNLKNYGQLMHLTSVDDFAEFSRNLTDFAFEST